MRVSRINLSVTGTDHLFLNVPLSKEKLCHRSSEAIFGDPTDSNLLAHHEISQMVSSSSCCYRLGSLPN